MQRHLQWLMAPATKLLTLSSRVYSLLLYAYPRPFRRECAQPSHVHRVERDQHRRAGVAAHPAVAVGPVRVVERPAPVSHRQHGALYGVALPWLFAIDTGAADVADLPDAGEPPVP